MKKVAGIFTMPKNISLKTVNQIRKNYKYGGYTKSV